MTVTSVSTAFLGNAMLPTVMQADAELTQLETESSTGEYADLGLQLGDQSGYELSLRNSDDLLQTITTANSIANGAITTASTALASIHDDAQSALTGLISWTPNGTASLDLAASGDEALQSLVNFSNTTYADDYVFGGINSGVAPMAAYSSSSPSQTAIANAFETQFGVAPGSAGAGSISASAMQSFLAGPFDDLFTGTNWSTNWSSASSVNTTAEISPGQTVVTSTNLNAGGFQDLAQGYAMLAAFGGAGLSTAAQQTVVNTATSLITSGMSQITTMSTQLGTTQGQIKQADDDMDEQLTLLKTQIGGLDNVNPDMVATQLNTLTTQIETAYQITAQLQKLSLAQYLPT